MLAALARTCVIERTTEGKLTLTRPFSLSDQWNLNIIGQYAHRICSWMPILCCEYKYWMLKLEGLLM
ncbi:hypothetical protein AZE42_11755 [Rhizopogon vesiculosus]|uniref:Uncharacterized protein n=1 Tax=Rhizopogon vesiculosus TaxID=180088 RepID=A0A1J8PH04_9AGAM|nr:hypothetical protein AZE42_11755 [Rhizopogon vesiculosus]